MFVISQSVPNEIARAVVLLWRVVLDIYIEVSMGLD